MSKAYLSMAVLVLALSVLVGCDYESRAVAGASPVRVAEMQKTLRGLWLGHIYLIQHVVLINAVNDPAELEAADKQVLANAQQIANTVTPFYGEATSAKLFALLTGHYAAVKLYSEATVADSKSQQDAALAHLASNANDIDVFFNRVNPSYLPKGTIGGLIEAHCAHHVLQINQYKKKEYAHLDATWPMMRQHVYVIADTLTAALAKQFPDKFS